MARTWAFGLAMVASVCAGRAAAADAALLIHDPIVLDALEARGHALASRLAATEDARTNAALYRRSPWYRGVVDFVEQTLDELQDGDAKLGPTMRSHHRLFDKRWLLSARARFELAAVVNRMDRQPFHPGTCGETRLIYRLRYTQAGEGAVTSRLPFTMNVVSWQDADCKKAAQAWLGLRGKTGPQLVEAVAGLGLTKQKLKSVEINFQSVRWPSTIRPDLGAHAEYVLAVFKPDARGQKLVSATLENTPDVEKLQKSPVMRKELLEFLTDAKNAKALEGGTLVIPEKFLATTSTSVSPRGLTRLQNRPYAQLFSKELTSMQTRRMDDMSCAGCHQNRTVAGFHALGVDRADTPPANAILVTGSPHLMGDLKRRAAFVEAVARGETPRAARPLSERADEADGGYGAHCGLGDPAFRAWSCKLPLVCKAVGNAKGDDTVGQCFPNTTEPQVGDPCESGTMVPHADGRRDKVIGAKEVACAAGVCEVDSVGFPEGMCAVRCGGTEEKSGEAACGSIAILAGFNGCLAKGKPFTACLADNVRPAGLRACGDDKPCRDDYLCARTVDGRGACIPPYFLFQMRVDGHPKP